MIEPASPPSNQTHALTSTRRLEAECLLRLCQPRGPIVCDVLLGPTQVKVSLLNFTITIKGLEEQLLNTAVKEELPDLAQKKVPPNVKRFSHELIVQGRYDSLRLAYARAHELNRANTFSRDTMHLQRSEK